MRVLVSGATGFIGRALVGGLEKAGHRPVSLARSGGGAVTWNIDDGSIDRLEGFDAVVHLAGESISGRWTKARKVRIMESRRVGTRLLAEAVAEAGIPVMVSGSAIGFYGDRGDEELTEDSTSGEGFLAEVVREWEASTAPAIEAGTRTVLARTGLVLDRSGGSFPRMLLPYRLLAGGPIGSGRQYWSWITLEDETRALIHCLEQSLSGPVNLVAPNPVENRRFAAALGKAMHRPSLFPAPALALKLALGAEMASELLLASQRVTPTRLQAAGFEWKHPTVGPALVELMS